MMPKHLITKGYRNVPYYDNSTLQAIAGDKLPRFGISSSEIIFLSEALTGTLGEQIAKINSINTAGKLDAYNKIIETGFNQSKSIEEALGIILGTYLKIYTNRLNYLKNLKLAWKFWEHMIRVYKQTCSYKKNSNGVPISSKNKSARYLLEHYDNLSYFFLRSDNYIPAVKSKRWKPTDELRTYIKLSVNKLCDMLYDIYCSNNFRKVPSHMFPKMLASRYNNIYIIVLL